MSFLEVRDRGLPYGGIPYQELLNKLEETDTNQNYDDHITNYNNYIRSEIIDWSTDSSFLESDRTRRDPSLSKSIINLRYNGSRGDYERPCHPELFIGFMDQDPRSLDNNPRMEQYQKQINTRMPNLEIRMGHNATDTDHESPWTNQSLGQCRRDIQTALNYNTKVFTDERDGRALNRNFVAEYDHNKKGLIYKDLLPNSLTNENIAGKSNTQYTTSSVPFVSPDSEFRPSYKNNTVGFNLGKKDCATKVGHDHVNIDEYKNIENGKYSMQYGSKVKNNNSDQVHKDHFDGIDISRNLLPQTKYVSDKTDTYLDVNNLTKVENTSQKSNINSNVTDPTLIDNDSRFNESNYSDVRRFDMMKYSNANTYINTELNPNDLLNYENEAQKSIIMNGNNNNITLVNSSYYIPEFKFKHMEIAKHGYFPDNQTVITKTKYDNPYGYQNESLVKSNKYKFNDNIGKIMTYSTSNVPDTTYETQMRHFGHYNQDNRAQNIGSEEVWAASDENTLGKMQKQSRTGGIEPVDLSIDVVNQENPDFEVKNGGSIIGNKSIRGDTLNKEMSENIYDSY